jgi:hypothetical protein
MVVPTKDLLFRPSKDDKAQTTTSVARSIAAAETEAREAKTARLKKLRLQKEAAEAAAAAEAPQKKAVGKRKAPAA